MELPVVLWNLDNHIYRIYREPTEDDNFIREHNVDFEGNLTPKPRRGAVSPNHHHTYMLFDDNDEVNKVYKCVRVYYEGEGTERVQKAVFREIADERHTTALDERITPLETARLITKGAVETAQVNATGAGSTVTILFADEDKDATNWEDGAVTLSQGTYDVRINIHCNDVHINTNHVTLEAVIENANDSTATTNKLYIKDADRLVSSSTSEWVDSRSFILDLPYESNKVSFMLTISGHSSDSLSISTNSLVYILRI